MKRLCCILALLVCGCGALAQSAATVLVVANANNAASIALADYYIFRAADTGGEQAAPIVDGRGKRRHDHAGGLQERDRGLPCMSPSRS